jgi:hypothetical protein
MKIFFSVRYVNPYVSGCFILHEYFLKMVFFKKMFDSRAGQQIMKMGQN